MADILRDFEFCELHGSHRRAERGSRRSRLPAYVDTGAGRTVVSSEVARRVGMIEAPDQVIDYAVPIRVRSRAFWTAMRMVEKGCVRWLPILCAVSDEVIEALDLPGGLQVLVGQDYLQHARVRMDLAPSREEGDQLVCRDPTGGPLGRREARSRRSR
jgi:hypothetical protein